MRFTWTNEADRILVEHYSDTSTKELAELFGASEGAVYHRAHGFGLKKSPEFLSSSASGRIARGDQMSPETRFKPGQKSWCKGLKIGTKGRTAETQFKPGSKPHNYKPVGTEQTNSEGYLIVKVSDDGIQRHRWQFKHRLVWEAVKGEIPKGHMLNFKDGNRLNCALENLELVTRAEHAARHGINSLHPEIRKVLQLRGVIQRHINRREGKRA